MSRAPISACALVLLVVAPEAATAQREATLTPPAEQKNRPRDLGDTAAGTYFGNVMSDARGSSQSDVRVTVTRSGWNKVRVAFDYPRMPAFETDLTRAMETIQNKSGSFVFLLELSKSPHGLMITVDDAAWAGTRE